MPVLACTPAQAKEIAEFVADARAKPMVVSVATDTPITPPTAYGHVGESEIEHIELKDKKRRNG